MRADTADKHASSHSGQFDGFAIIWPTELNGTNKQGWYVEVDGCAVIFGPYATSQAAFGAVKDGIDKVETG